MPFRLYLFQQLFLSLPQQPAVFLLLLPRTHLIYLSGPLGTLPILLYVRFLFWTLGPIPQLPQLLLTESYSCLCYLGASIVLGTQRSRLVLPLHSHKQASHHTERPGPEHNAEGQVVKRGQLTESDISGRAVGSG